MASGAAAPDLALLDRSDLLDRLAQENDQLARAGVSLRLELRGLRLGLRGPLPCRRGSGRHRMQRISLGLHADGTGLERAKERLKEVLRQQRQGRFDWSQWGGLAPAGPVQPSGDPLGLEGFEAAFFGDPRRRRNPAGCRTTWSSAYRPYLRRLLAIATEQGLPLELPLLERVLES